MTVLTRLGFVAGVFHLPHLAPATQAPVGLAMLLEMVVGPFWFGLVLASAPQR